VEDRVKVYSKWEEEGRIINVLIDVVVLVLDRDIKSRSCALKYQKISTKELKRYESGRKK